MIIIIIIMVIIFTIIICYCACVLFQVGAQFSSVSALRGEGGGLQNAYITVSIVSCSIVHKGDRGKLKIRRKLVIKSGLK